MNLSPVTRRLSARFSLSLVFTLLLALLLAGPALAQGIIIIEPPHPPLPDPSPRNPVVVDSILVDAQVDGPVATVQVTQIVRNPTSRAIEGSFVFPLPQDAGVDSFQMSVDGQVLEGQILDREAARRIYEEIVRRQIDPALLEYVQNGLFRTSVFPIPANGTRTLTLTYSQLLPGQDGLFRFRYPLPRPGLGDPGLKSLAITVELVNQPGLRAIYSPSHEVTIQRQDDANATVSFEASAVRPEQDFDLFFGTDQSQIGAHLLSYKPTGEDGFFALLTAPALELDASQIVARDLVLVVDISGSMEGAKMAQAQEAARYLITHLNPEDRFNLVSFSSAVRLWQGDLQPATASSVAAAGAWIDTLTAGGGTDINRALLESLALLEPGDENPAYILFLTDGLPSRGLVETNRILGSVLANRPAGRSLRLFPFGVGFDVNTDLLDQLSQEMGGRSSYVTPDERIDEEVSQFYARVSTPVLVNIALDFGDLTVYDTLPFPMPDLFAGEQLVLVGRYPQGGETRLTLSGTANGQAQTFAYPDLKLTERGGEPFVARLWATRKIGILLQDIRRNGVNQELVDEIVALSLQYGIVTPYTSYLVVEPEFQDQVNASTSLRMGAPAARSLSGEAAAQVGRDMAAAAEAAPMGAAAVAASEERQKLASADRVAASAEVRYVNGKSFTAQGEVIGPDGTQHTLWVDTAYQTEMASQTILFGSDAYFDLLAQENAAGWLALSPELLLVLDGQALRITVSDAPMPVPTATPIPTPTPSSPWWQWWRR